MRNRAHAMKGVYTRTAYAVAACGLVFLAGCHTDMWVQNKVNRPLAPSDFFQDGQSARPPVPRTVARGHLQEDTAYSNGIVGGTRVNVAIGSGAPVETGIFRGQFVDTFPFPITKPVLERGQNRFNIYCSPCHGRVGDGNGMIALRGFSLRKPPANFHTDRLRRMPVGHFFDVITNGYGVMYSYGERIPDPSDRWAIVAYIRALQLSQHAPAADVPAGQLGNAQAEPVKPLGPNPANPAAGNAAPNSGRGSNEGMTGAGRTGR